MMLHFIIYSQLRSYKQFYSYTNCGGHNFGRRSMWIRVDGGREAVEGEGGSSEPVAVQERRGVRGVLQSEVPGQEHMFEKSGDNNRDGRVPRLHQG